MENMQAKSVQNSRTAITELMIPSYANFGGKIHGGILLSLMDKVAYATATKHSGAYCVTVSVDNVDFLQPVEVGELVSLLASVNYVGNSSMIIGIKVIAENVKTGLVKHTNTSYFTMVAKNEDGRLKTVPKLILETKEDVRRFAEAVRRKELKKKYQERMETEKSEFTIDKQKEHVENQRCEVMIEE
jgi:uncharacterized protein (TIGR00369 family)